MKNHSVLFYHVHVINTGISTEDKSLMFQSGCHGNQVSIAMRYEADAYCLKESPNQI